VFSIILHFRLHHIDAAYCYSCHVYLSLCWTYGCAVKKTAELIEMPFGSLTQMTPRSHVLDGCRDLPREREGTVLIFGVVRTIERQGLLNAQ